MITRIEIILILLENALLKKESGSYRRMKLNLLRMSDYDFCEWYRTKFGHILTPIRKNLYI